MNLNFTVADQAFRKEVKNFLNENLSQDIATKMKADFELSKVEIESWHAVVACKRLDRTRLAQRPLVAPGGILSNNLSLKKNVPLQARRASYPLASKCLHPC